MALSVLGLIVVVVGLVLLAVLSLGITLGIRQAFRRNPNRIPCPGCSRTIVMPIERCPHCGQSLG